ncbi:hypothetical protein AB0M34_23380 [Nocardia sp. NPDC050193]
MVIEVRITGPSRSKPRVPNRYTGPTRGHRGAPVVAGLRGPHRRVGSAPEGLLVAAGIASAGGLTDSLP